MGYGAYFWAYEKLMQREIRKGVRREDVSPVKAVLFGAAAGYAVRSSLYALPHFSPLNDVHLSALGMYLPHRHDKISYADGRVFACYGSKVQINS